MGKKTEQINIRCTKVQKERIAQKAEKAKVNISEYVLAKAVNGTGRVRSTKADMARCNAQFQVQLNTLERMIFETNNQELIAQVKEVQKAEDDRWTL